MPDTAAHEATTDQEVKAWHDQAYAEYETALNAYMADCTTRREAGDLDGVDEALLAAYEETRDNLQAGVVYWRQVGEQVGTRTGVAVVDNVLPEGEAE
jgi:hypothetical protein